MRVFKISWDGSCKRIQCVYYYYYYLMFISIQEQQIWDISFTFGQNLNCGLVDFSSVEPISSDFWLSIFAENSSQKEKAIQQGRTKRKSVSEKLDSNFKENFAQMEIRMHLVEYVLSHFKFKSYYKIGWDQTSPKIIHMWPQSTFLKHKCVIITSFWRYAAKI